MNKAAALVVVLLGSSFVADKGSKWFGNTFNYTQAMRDSDELTKESNKQMIEYAEKINATKSAIGNYGLH